MAISYCSVFSIASLLLIVMEIAGFVWWPVAIEGEMARHLAGLQGPEVAQDAHTSPAAYALDVPGLCLRAGFLPSVSQVVSTGLSAFGRWAEGWLAASEALLDVARMSLSLGIATLLLSAMLKLVPRASVA